MVGGEVYRVADGKISGDLRPKERVALSTEGQHMMMARCVVCRGDIYLGDRYEHTDTGYYCERHSLPYLWARAEEYRRLLEAEEARSAGGIVD